ncbi:hypothetical protein PR202_ga28362 [Eleusine coracana subsp. coracana]|uniref:DUF4220 domain-containing protein n=1 Tax=Eleusine coracana subsp. coracana TaxID=191504 RepID=A0AAV5DIZ5_ELECO|nr:hypothetical protein PR202_ga28362 [Eleusine coracana subsp. coracana]
MERMGHPSAGAGELHTSGHAPHLWRTPSVRGLWSCNIVTWSAYQLADSVAIYVLGHMSVSIIRSPEHELVAFWALFVLMHLGGQDNIAAYAIEDTRLWLRHLQTLAVQVAAASYVLYASSIFSHSTGRGYHYYSLLLQVATILMFVVGTVKYGERVWALQHAASSSASDKKYRSFTTTARQRILYMGHETRANFTDAEYIVFLGHRMLDVPKDLLKGPLPYEVCFRKESRGGMSSFRLKVRKAYEVAEVQVSLMHDIFYTKAESQYGVIRVVSSLATTVVLLLLLLLLLGSSDRHNNNDNGYNKVDVAITCVLSVGAGVLEAMSLLRYILSSFNWYWHWRVVWYLRLPVHASEPVQHWRVLTPLRRLVHASEWRLRYSWSRSMGQHNMLQVCVRNQTTSWSSKMALCLGVEDWWNTLVCSWSIPVSPIIKQMVVKQVKENWGISETNPDHIRNSRGRAVLKSQQLYDTLDWSVDPGKLSLEESILTWHLATELYLSWRQNDGNPIAKPVEALSNYMLFLLAARPNMLPPSTSRNAYVEMCYCLTSLEYTSAEGLAHLLRRYGDTLKNNPGSTFDFPCHGGRSSRSVHMETLNNTVLRRGSHLAAKLIAEESQSPHMLKLIGKVWVELLCYAGSRCTAYSHVKQLSEGGELITVIAFLIEYLKRAISKICANIFLLEGPKEWVEENSLDGRSSASCACMERMWHSSVLLSFTLQVILLILAEFRRRVDSGVLRFFVWSAYQLASIAIYVLGHMSVTGGIRSPEHDLVTFWAPFLLMHLGGQDSHRLRHGGQQVVAAPPANRRRAGGCSRLHPLCVFYLQQQPSLFLAAPAGHHPHVSCAPCPVSIGTDTRQGVQQERGLLAQVSFRNKVSRSSKIARWLGVEDIWNTLACSWSIPVLPFVKQMVLKQVLESCDDDETSPDHILNSRGRAVLKKKSQQLYDRLQWSVDPDELSLEETILMWHMATDIYLRWYKVLVVASRRCELDDLAKAVEALSNYMLFILTARPYMLPPSSSSHYAYVKMCYHLTYLDKYTSVEDMAYLLLHYGNLIKNNREIPHKKWDTALQRGSVLAAKLIDELCGQDLPSADMLELIGKVWVEMLCYVGSRCSGYSHAKQLSNGGELLTVVAFVIEFLKSGLLKASGSTPIANAV